ncbi:hypothetical protein J2X85_000748 [Microbacterium trichothecenolyticum]|uniref:hypothetical protein n=1 Tax=Microbacterium trichothecenolyticum TaxID=69370 RepID=UPI0028673727|nr:hypothetical protein [Microbacterium trichothecenolyticum]MDR7183725.1 hypothetical protein [Microbacterium trichothecenolyticum]
MKHMRAAATIAAVSGVVLGMGATAAASAAPGHVDHFDEVHQESFTAHDPDLCDGLLDFPVEWEEHEVGSFRITERQGQGYGGYNATLVGSYTNVDTGLAYHYDQRVNSKDQKLVPSDIGGLTVTFMDRFNVFWTDDLGRAAFHDAGANTVTVEVDENGDFVEFIDDHLRGRGDTEGRDFCDDLIEFTTPPAP